MVSGPKERCEECGFEYDLARSDEAGREITELVDRLAALLGDPPPAIAQRRTAAVWSPLEYACHVRDVLLVQRERVLAARRVDRPSFDPMGRDERVAHDGYAEQEPANVARQLIEAARLFANVLSRLSPTDWERTVTYNHPSPAERSLRWVAVHTVHEVRHHRLDITRQVRPTDPTTR